MIYEQVKIRVFFALLCSLSCSDDGGDEHGTNLEIYIHTGGVYVYV